MNGDCRFNKCLGLNLIQLFQTRLAPSSKSGWSLVWGSVSAGEEALLQHKHTVEFGLSITQRDWGACGQRDRNGPSGWRGRLSRHKHCHKFNTAIHLCLLWATPFSTTPKRHLSPFVLALSLSLSPSLPPKKQQRVALSFSLSGIRSVLLFQACTTAGREQNARIDTSFYYRVGNKCKIHSATSNNVLLLWIESPNWSLLIV